MWAKRYIVYTTKSQFGPYTMDFYADSMHMVDVVNVLDDMIEADASLEYVKSLLTEI